VRASGVLGRHVVAEREAIRLRMPWSRRSTIETMPPRTNKKTAVADWISDGGSGFRHDRCDFSPRLRRGVALRATTATDVATGPPGGAGGCDGRRRNRGAL
jgi:hypothetical protein